MLKSYKKQSNKPKLTFNRINLILTRFLKQ